MFRAAAMLPRNALCALALLAAGSVGYLDRESKLASRAATLPGPLQLPGHLNSDSEPERRSPGHFLTKRELDPISSVACLKAKQQNPAINCTSGVPDSVGYSAWSGELNAGNFPSYKDVACHSDGALLCDPDQVLREAERAAVAAQLAKSRAASPVICGHSIGGMPEQLRLQPFYLGVVIIKSSTLSQSQPEYLQQLGQILTAQWDMNDAYVGSSIPYARCPNTGILIILPESDQAYLSTDTCEFLCQSRGGDQVVSATLAGLRGAGGPSAAALAGIREVYKFLGNVSEAGAQNVEVASVGSDDSKEDWLINVQRIMFVLSFVLFVGSSVVGGLLLWLAPGLLERRREK